MLMWGLRLSSLEVLDLAVHQLGCLRAGGDRAESKVVFAGHGRV